MILTQRIERAQAALTVIENEAHFVGRNLEAILAAHEASRRKVQEALAMLEEVPLGQPRRIEQATALLKAALEGERP